MHALAKPTLFGIGLTVAISFASAAAAGPYGRPITYTLDNSFDATERLILRRALSIVADRFLDPRMFHAADRNYRRASTHQALRFSSLNHFEAWFNNTQLEVLRRRGFPHIRIRAGYATAASVSGRPWAGLSHVGIVKTYWRRVPVRQLVSRYPVRYVTRYQYVPIVQGSFDIAINRYLLGNRDRFAYCGHDVNVWAGIIAHEMLHNLGHTHPPGTYQRTFIREYENAIRFNGNYTYR